MRRALLPLLCTALLASACGRAGYYGPDQTGDSGVPTPVGAEVDKLSLVPKAIVVYVGEETPIEVWGRYLGGWKPLGLDGSLGFVTEGETFEFNGLAVHGLAEGTGVLRVTRGRLTAEAPVVVLSERRATAIAIGPTPLTLAVGGTQALSIIATYEDGSAATITEDPQLLLSVAGDAVKLDGAILMGVAAGQARIDASWQGLQSFLGVRVIEPQRELVALEVTPAQTALQVGETVRFTVTGWLSDGTPIDLSRASSGTRYGTSNPAVLEDRGDGLYFAIGAGESDVRVNNGAFEAVAYVGVFDGTVQRSMIGLVLEPGDLVLSPGETVQLRAIALYDDGTNEDVTTLTGFMIDENLPVVIDPGGTMTAFAPGAGWVYAYYGGFEAALFVDIRGMDRVLIGFALNPDRLELVSGDFVQIMAIGTYSDGTQEDLACASSWTSTSRRSVDVSGGCGTVVARRPGDVTVTATSPDGTFTAEARISVLRP